MSNSEQKNPGHLNPALAYRPASLPPVQDVLLAFGLAIPGGDAVGRLQSSQVEEKSRVTSASTPPDVALLSRCITALESETLPHRQWAEELMDRIGHATADRNSFRLGISGSPGVGKSTFIEGFGLELIERGHRVAVLAVDPSSQLSGGSILGDKTRMEELGRHPAAYVRPSPSGGFLGGVSRVTRETILLCEAAGYDYILVETVGVGQSEMAVHSMTDAFLLLAQPGAGDELQGIKRGILEMADFLVVNKMDILPKEVTQTAGELRRSLHLAPPRTNGWVPPVVSIAALNRLCFYEVYQLVEKYRQLVTQNGELRVKRMEQRKNWLEEVVQTELLSSLHRSTATQAVRRKLNQRIEAGDLDIYRFAAEILRTFHAENRRDA